MPLGQEKFADIIVLKFPLSSFSFLVPPPSFKKEQVRKIQSRVGYLHFLSQRTVVLVRELGNQIQQKFLSEMVDKMVLKIIRVHNLYSVNVNILLCNFSVKNYICTNRKP
jgi:hypothetical protein